jgi:ABC-2 type transport system ATP-binding protein
MAQETPALSIQNLVKTYGGVQVVKDLSLDVKQGEMMALLGPNGAGKSTTINLIGGVARMEAGEIKVFGYDNQKDFISTRSQIGLMHQEIVTDTFFTIDRALKIHAGYYGKEDDPKWRNLLIDKLALRPHLKKHMTKLSGGMKRRFMVAKALIHKPKLLILDEPTAGVDVELRRTMWDFVREINRQGTTVLLTTHYLEEAEEMCERVGIMDEGKLVALEKTHDLLNKLDERRICFTLAKPLKEVPESLKSLGFRKTNGGRELAAKIQRNQSLTPVLDSIRQNGLEVNDLHTENLSLEEAFLQLTKRH